MRDNYTMRNNYTLRDYYTMRDYYSLSQSIIPEVSYTIHVISLFYTPTNPLAPSNPIQHNPSKWVPLLISSQDGTNPVETISTILGDNGITIYQLSTYDEDYTLVRGDRYVKGLVGLCDNMWHISAIRCNYEFLLGDIRWHIISIFF